MLILAKRILARRFFKALAGALFGALAALVALAALALWALPARAEKIDWSLDGQLEIERAEMGKVGAEAYANKHEFDASKAYSMGLVDSWRVNMLLTALGRFFQGRPDEALNWLDRIEKGAGPKGGQAPREDPRFTLRVENLRALAFLSKMDVKLAEATFQRALFQGSDGAPYLLWNAANFYRSVKKDSYMALVYFRRFLKSAEADDPRRDAAEAAAKELEKLYENKPPPLLEMFEWNVGREVEDFIRLQKGKDLEAEGERLRDLMAANIEDGEFQAALVFAFRSAACFVYGGVWDEAMRVLDQTARLYYGKKDWDETHLRLAAASLNMYGVALANAGYPLESTETLFMEANAADPLFPAPLFNLGKYYESMGEKEFSEDYLNQYRELAGQ